LRTEYVWKDNNNLKHPFLMLYRSYAFAEEKKQ